MTRERSQILGLLAEGAITVEQAEELLDAVGEVSLHETGTARAAAPLAPMPPAPPAPPIPLAPPTTPVPPVPPAPPVPPLPVQERARVHLSRGRPESRGVGRKLNFDELIQLTVHGIGPEFLREVRDAGLTDLTVDEVATLGIHGVRPAWIKEMRDAGFDDLTVDQLVELRIHGVEPAFVREVRDAGVELDVDQIVQLRVHGLNVETVQAWAAYGFVPEELEQGAGTGDR